MNDPTLIFSKIDHFNENLMSNIQGGVIICQFEPMSGKSKTIYMSEGWTKLTGYTLEELNRDFGGNPQALVYPDDAQRANRDYIEQTAHGNSYQLEYRCCHKDGRLIWVIDRGVITETAEGYNQNQSIISDITPMKLNEERLRVSEARFRLAMNATRAAVFEYDIEEKRYLDIENAEVIFRAGAQAVLAAFDTARERSAGFTMEDVFRQWYHPEDLPLLLHAYDEMQTEGMGECEVRVKQPGGGYLWCRLHQAAVEEGDGKPRRVVGHLVDIEEQHRQTERLLMEAQSDALTGLYNKNAIRSLVERTLRGSPNVPHALFMLDIDNFKGVNDQLGHLFGDAVLMAVSSKLRRLFRRDGVVGRIGGDEFVALLQSGSATVEARAEEICEAFRHTYSGEKKDYKISCSVGVAFSEPEDSFETLFHKADLALYCAKAMGKDQYVVYTPELSRETDSCTVRINQTDNNDSGKLKIKERIFELLYDSVDFTGSVNMILALLGQLLEASHIHIFENTPDNRFAEPIYQWQADASDGAERAVGASVRLPVGELDYYAQFDDTGVFRCRDFDELPNAHRKIYEDDKVTFTFQVAIMEENSIRGFMRYDSAVPSFIPRSEQIDIMIFAAKATGTFIIKKRADENARMYNQNKMDALDKLPSAIYVIDEEYRLEYVNNFVREYYPDIQLGRTCHDVFMRESKPCIDCPATVCHNGPCSTEIYNRYSKLWMVTSASMIRWSGSDNMRLLCCQIINQYKDPPPAG